MTPCHFSCRSRYALVVVAAATALLACGDAEPPTPPPPEIAVAQVVQRDQPIVLEMVGETRGSVDIPIRARVDGFLEGIHFAEGREVDEGQLLYTIDAQPFEAKVAEARGKVAEADTMVAKTSADLERIRPLAEINAVSQQDLDAAVAQYEAAKGSLQAAQARQEQAELELGYTRVHAPVSGRIGITQVRVGEYVGTGTRSLLNYVSKIHPIRVRFSIDERNYLRLARRLRALEKREMGERERVDLELVLSDGTVHDHRGKVVALDAAIDAGTGTFTLEADFPNPDGIVLAGQFARVRGVIAERKDALLVPLPAVMEMQGEFRVFVVDDDGKVSLRSVELGPRIDRLRLVEAGLQPGDKVVMEGVQRLKDGATVVPKIVSLDDEGGLIKPGAEGATNGGA